MTRPDPVEIDKTLDRLTINVRNSALEAAAKVAKLYGAPDEAVKRILMLKGKESTDA